MTDPSYDDGRDLRAALGGLLTDEPTAPWSVQDDVRRGEALRTRRRTRALGTVGIAAALALVVGVLGPWGLRPLSAPPASSPSGLDKNAVSSLLTSLGWEVSDVADVRSGPGGPTVTKWSVRKGGGNVNASLTVRTWDESQWPERAGDPPGSVLAACDGACGAVSMALPDCVEGPCWDESSTTLVAERDGAVAGSAVLRSRSEWEGLAVELVTSPESCATCTGVVRPFLAEDEQRRVLVLVQQQMLGASPIVPPVAGRECTSDDVKLVPGPDPVPGPAGLTALLVTVVPRNPDVSCVLTPYPTIVGLDRDGAELPYVQKNSGLEQAVSIGGADIAALRVASPVCASVGGDLATLRVTLAGGGAPADVSVAMLVPVVSCASPAPSTDMIVQAYEPAAEASSAPTEPVRGCQNGDVVAEVVPDVEGGASGERSIALRFTAREGVTCRLEGTPTAWLVDGSVMDLTQVSGGYQGLTFDGSPVVLSGADTATVVLATVRCDVGEMAVGTRVQYALPGDRSVGVSQVPIPADLQGPGRCAAGPADQKLWVSPFHAVR